MSAGLGLSEKDDAPIAVCGDEIVTRAALRRQSDALLALLSAQGVKRALVCSDDPVVLLRAIDACNRAGADLFIAHTSLPAQHVEDIVAEFGIGLRIGAEDEIRTPSIEGDAPSARIFMMTSGTTGRPKIASHDLQTLLARARAGVAKGGADQGKWLLTYQPTGFAGIQVILTAALTGGLIVSPQQRNPSGFVEAAKRWQVTQISGTPTFWRSFLMAAPVGALSLRQVTLGGEAADQATLKRVKAAFPDARVTHTYASTEAGVVFAVHDGLEGFPASWLDTPRPGAQLRVRDGFLQIKTESAMRGYITESTQPLLEDGWLATSDRCEVQGDRAKILGRDDSTINVGGSKVYPLAIEQFLLSQPGVVEARAYGAPNPISGFLVGADVVLEQGLDAGEARPRILAACREHLAGYQVPRVFKIVEAIEVRASGKKG